MTYAYYWNCRLPATNLTARFARVQTANCFRS